MIKLTNKIPMCGFLQEGDLYNKEVTRTETQLVVERCNIGCSPWYTTYTKKTFLGLIEYWSYDGWSL